MSNEGYVVFLKGLLVKIENALNLINQPTPKHIPSYRKMLGVKQKISELPVEYRTDMFTQLIGVRGVINYFLNGRYEEAYLNIIRLRDSIIKICLEKEKNEKNTIEKIQKENS